MRELQYTGEARRCPYHQCTGAKEEEKITREGERNKHTYRYARKNEHRQWKIRSKKQGHLTRRMNHRKGEKGEKEGEEEKYEASSIQVTTLHFLNPSQSPPFSTTSHQYHSSHALTYSLPRIHIAPILPLYAHTRMLASSISLQYHPFTLHSPTPQTPLMLSLTQHLSPQQPLTPSPSPITHPVE